MHTHKKGVEQGRANQEAKDLAAIPYILDSFIEANSGVDMVFDFEGSFY